MLNPRDNKGMEIVNDIPTLHRVDKRLEEKER